MKCCGVIPNEMSLSEITELLSEKKRMNNQHEFVSNGEGVNYSILWGSVPHSLGYAVD